MKIGIISDTHAHRINTLPASALSADTITNWLCVRPESRRLMRDCENISCISETFCNKRGAAHKAGNDCTGARGIWVLASIFPSGRFESYAFPLLQHHFWLNGNPNRRRASLDASSELPLIRNVISIPWVNSTLSMSISGKSTCSPMPSV